MGAANRATWGLGTDGGGGGAIEKESYSDEEVRGRLFHGEIVRRGVFCEGKARVGTLHRASSLPLVVVPDNQWVLIPFKRLDPWRLA